VTKDELAKVIKQARSQFVYAMDGVMNVGGWLGQLEIVASYKMYETFLDNLAQVTRDDVLRVAARYLGETNRTVGWFVPTNEGAIKKRARK
jgi:predicted Zn-dependent peptidase